MESNIIEEKKLMQMELESAQSELKQLRTVHANELLLISSEKDAIISTLQQQLNASKQVSRTKTVLREIIPGNNSSISTL